MTVETEQSRRPRVLIVDDEPSNLDAIQRTLRTHFEISAFASAELALRALKSQQFEAIISDQRMPKMCGTEFLALAAKEQPLATRIILTAHSESREILDAINRAEIFRYITKPWENSELTGAVSRAAELSLLKQSHNALLESLRAKTSHLEKKEAELTALNENLEVLVRERTKDLQVLNERLSQLAQTDSLTDLPNRRALFSKLHEEITRSFRYNHKLSVAMIDIDHFKALNDAKGHLAGDSVLKAIAHTLQTTVRRTDLVARFGGEEFCLLMPETTREEAKELCERLRKVVKEIRIDGLGDQPLSISVGISEFPASGGSVKELIDAADKALYSAKRTGRDKVVLIEGGNVSFFAS